MLLNTSFEKMMQGSPHHVFWKQKNLNYLGCNKIVLETLGLNDYGQIINKSDHELAWNSQANYFIEEDMKILRNEELIVNKKFTVTVLDKKFLMTTSKHPLIDKKHRIVGVFGIAIDITPPYMRAKNLNLTNRQATCLYYLVRGLTAKQIAKILQLSNRTIEDYFNFLKIRLNCQNKADLIAWAINAGFGQ